MIIVVSGGFDPLHSGHISMFRQAHFFGEVWAIVNTDKWLQRKKGFVMLPYKERSKIVSSTQFIYKVIRAKDNDGTVVNSLKDINKPFAFANGGDRVPTTTPEMEYCLKNNIPMLFNIGGKKTMSSSNIARKLLDQAKK